VNLCRNLFLVKELRLIMPKIIEVKIKDNQSSKFDSILQMKEFLIDKSYISSRYINGKFLLVYSDNQFNAEKDIFVENKVSFSNFPKKLKNLIQKSSFPSILKQLSPEQPIYIKVNISPATQVAYHYYTTPQLVESLIEYLNDQGFFKVWIIEAENNFVWIRRSNEVSDSYESSNSLVKIC
jgi:hypothetical protein